ncbi:major facilitator superfamily domain-containing protein [Truncatella angustata]|uniref:Major facilitator superfamily domain-containing protein n=1 Tax=Truncatella angustata TaxID=152316 RepID=A0A9P8UUK0_9PEZI|nr:major facilitator superfamily domain-containing protein [Truncatella angustata]KAH6658493.1 major facilitator superfamily domain-containing protein [Truncatella angustata]
MSERTSEKLTDVEAVRDGLEPHPGSDTTQEAEANPSPRKVHGILWALVVISILSSIFLYAMDNTVVADITPAAANQFGDVVKLPWLAVGFLVGGTAVVLPFGKLYSLFDAKWLYIISLVIFNAGSALCGAAPSIDAFIVGRVLAGLGGNGMYLGVMTLLSVLTSDRERPGYLSFVGLVWGIGIILGPVVGGAFTESSATWRWAFYINLCIAGLFAPVYLFVIPSWKPRPGEKPLKLIREFDFVGAVLVIAAIITVIMAIQFGGSLYAWNSGTTIALFVVSGVLFVLFALQQTFTIFTSTANRMWPVHFMRNWNALLLFMTAAAVNTAGFIPIYYIPLYFQFTRGDSAIEAAVRLLPLIFVLSAAILANGHLMGRFSYFQPWYIFGSVLTLIGGVLLSRVTSDTPTGQIYGFEVLIGIGTGCFIQAGYAVIQGMVPASDMSYGISFMMIAQLGGIGLGLSIGGAVFINESLDNLSVLLPDISRDNLQLVITGTSSAALRGLTPEVRQQVIDVIVQAMGDVFILTYVAGAFCLVASMLFTKRKMFGDAVAMAG